MTTASISSSFARTVNSSAAHPRVREAIRGYYGFQLFFSLLLWLPIFYEYQRRIGLSDAQIFSIQSVYYLVFCLLELPTGVLADRFGALACCRAGAVVLAGSNLLPILVPGYSGFMAHFLMIALGRSLVSGAASAYLYDFLGAHEALSVYKQVEGNARAYGLAAKVVCWAGIGFLMNWHLTLPYWLTALTTGVSAYYAWTLPRLSSRSPAAAASESQVEPSLARKLAAVAGVLRRNPVLLAIMLQGVALFVLGRIGQLNLYQPILSSKSFGVGAFGIVMSVMTIFEAAGSARPGWLQRWLSDLNATFVLSLAMALSLAVIPLCGKWTTIAALCSFSYIAGLSFPIQRQLMNAAITDSSNRATLLSVESIIDRAANAWAAALTGGYLAAGRMDFFLVASAVATAGAMGLLFVYLDRNNRLEVAACQAQA